ncbi:MAG: hypothetical protein RLZZ524_2616 [Pseudomonadota bacterium]|jgi:hypothetical protein
MIRPLDAATLGLVAQLSRTVLAIAALGLLSPDAEPEPEPPRPGDSWLLGMHLQERQRDLRLDPMAIAIHACGAGLIS